MPTNFILRGPVPRSVSTALTLSALVLAACRAGDRGAGRSDSATDSASTTTAAAPNVVTIHARDFAFDAPKEVPAGLTTFRLVNDGPNFHHAQLVRLDSGKTFDDLQEALKRKGPPPRWMVPIGGPNAPDPNTEANATADMKPGNYALLCFVDMPDGVPHVAKGMAQPLTVTAASNGAASVPTADVVVTLRDYDFQLSKSVAAGKRTFEVRTEASQPHEIELIRLAPGKKAEDLLAWFGKPQGPPPGQGLGGVAALAPGAPAYFTADLTPGNYVLICFVPDAKDGKPHYVHGMIQTIQVT